MKIYFEDGELTRPMSVDFDYHYIVDARYGFTNNKSLLKHIRIFDNDGSIYTNSIIALSNVWAWNDELKVPEIYLVRNGKFVRIDKLTNKELRKTHNIIKMYMAGAFGEEE